MWACDAGLSSTVLNSYQNAGPLFMETLQTILAAQCALTGDHLWPADATKAVLEDPYYDFIVVGAGSAGAVIANRLSEEPKWKVLLVEAGGNPTLNTEIPQLFYSNLNTPEDWRYRTQPQEGACRSYKTKGCAWPRGKVLGGSSSINAMFYVRGNKADYDEWAAEGNNGWSYKEVLPYFRKSENFHGDYTAETEKYHGKHGYLNVVDDPNVHIFEKMIIQAGVELGIKNSSDICGESQMGIIKSFTTSKDGKRYSTARSFLTPIKDRVNLHVMKNAFATKILFKPGTKIVSGVQLKHEGKDITVNTKKELIISGGSINSPQLLLLSGIGPKEHLEDLGIEIKADLSVGENLQDHLFVPLFYSAPADPSLATTLPNIIQAYTQFLLESAGPLSDITPHRVIAFTNTNDPNATIPNVQHHFIVFPPQISNLLDIFEKHNLTDEVQSKFNEMSRDKLTLIVYSVLLKPKSAGKILLKSTNPFENPLIYANYFEDKEDLEIVVHAMKNIVLKLGETQSLKSYGFKKDFMDLEACTKFEKESDDYLECWAREMTFSLYHPTSSVKMGPAGDKTAVVDPELRVYGIERLRVADASIMPSVIRGNTNAAVIMIGEKAADLIRNYWITKHTEL